jgi:predicted amidophosphoribosyltransferase
MEVITEMKYGDLVEFGEVFAEWIKAAISDPDMTDPYDVARLLYEMSDSNVENEAQS